VSGGAAPEPDGRARQERQLRSSRIVMIPTGKVPGDGARTLT
jgi:hypothetical protein